MTVQWTKRQQKAHRAKWVKALRSGKYKQTKLELRSVSGGFCCLGVACDISGLGKWNAQREYVIGTDADGVFLPEPVKEWLGLAWTTGQMSDGQDLSDLNDHGKRFKTIAKVIESEPDGLIVPEAA